MFLSSLRRRACLALLTTLVAGAASAAPTLRLQACRLDGVGSEVRCGTLARPLDPARPDGPRFTLNVAVLPALSRQALPDPVVFFAGGPGQSAVDLAPTVQQLLGRLQTRRDILLIDQRGTGRSAPLYCEDARGAAAPLRESLDRKSTRLNSSHSQQSRMPSSA